MTKISTPKILYNKFPYKKGIDLHNEKLRRIIETLPVSMVVFDKDLRFVIASDRFFENSPLQKDKIKPLDHWYSIVPDMPKKWKLIHQRCLKGESLKCDEDPFYRKDGSIEWWRWEVVPLYEADKTIGGLILYAESITEQKTTEKNLRQMLRRLNESNNGLSKFAHACAHDLHAPLRTMSNYLQLLHKNLINDNRKTQEYYQVIMKNAEYMSTLIHKTLQYSNDSREEVSKTWFEMADIVENLLIILNDDIQAKNATISWEKLPKIFADKVLIYQVVQNLVLNALHYNDSKTPILKIFFEENSNHWTLAFQDNGPGINKINLSKIFRAYHRATPEKKCDGLGLGLYKCKKIIASHGGRMWGESELNRGTTFYFTLPKGKESF